MPAKKQQERTGQSMSDKLKAVTNAGKKRGKYLATRYTHIVRYPGNNLYYLFWKHKGKRYEQSLETDVESRALVKADEKIKEIKARHEDGAPVTTGKISLDDLLTHFLNAQKCRVEAHEFKQRTYEAIEDGVKPGPIPAEPSVKHTWDTWAEKTPAPKPGEIRMLASFHNGPVQTGEIDHEKEYAEAAQDPEFAQLCRLMGLSVEDAIRFHKLNQQT
jgi:hypothetical protein